MNLPVQIPDQEILAVPEVNGYELICQMRKTPTVLYGIFTEAVRTFYHNASNLPIMAPAGISWDPDPKKTQMWIDTELRWETEHPELRPAIYCALGSLEYKSLTGRHDGMVQTDLRTAEIDFSRSGSGNVQYIHVGANDGEACTLADATLDYMDAFSVAIRDDFCFTTLELVGRVPLMRRQKESTERWGSVVTLAFSFEDTWTLKLESQVLKAFSTATKRRMVEDGTVTIS